ncbi:MAG: hypothetical protein M1281_08570 [Chloroflexi bacterium]|nr:hypothetical protein [Chloroflexota bacterium]
MLWSSLVMPETIKAVTGFYTTRMKDCSRSPAACLGTFAESEDWMAASRVDAYHAEAAQLAWERAGAFVHDRLDDQAVK